MGFLTAEAAEAAGAEAPTAENLITLAEALQLKELYHPSTLVAVRGSNPRLIAEAAYRIKGLGESSVYVLFVDEIPGLFYPPKVGPSEEAREVLGEAAREFRRHGIEPVTVWRMAHDAGASIAAAATALGISAVTVGTSARSAMWHLLRGNVLKELIRLLPEGVRLLICN